MSPFKSQKQAKFMFAKKPELAQEFADKTPSIKALPTYAPPQPKGLKAAMKERKK